MLCTELLIPSPPTSMLVPPVISLTILPSPEPARRERWERGGAGLNNNNNANGELLRAGSLEELIKGLLCIPTALLEALYNSQQPCKVEINSSSLC